MIDLRYEVLRVFVSGRNQPKFEPCYHKHDSLSEALKCRERPEIMPRCLFKTIIMLAHAGPARSIPCSRVYWLNEEEGHFEAALDRFGRISNTFLDVPVPADFEKAARAAFSKKPRKKLSGLDLLFEYEGLRRSA